jgi:hypothetical protein
VKPTDSIGVVLEAQQWNVVMATLQEAPYRVAQPIVQALAEQFAAAARAAPDRPDDP